MYIILNNTIKKAPRQGAKGGRRRELLLLLRKAP
jgi:hypothetical protein